MFSVKKKSGLKEVFMDFRIIRNFLAHFRVYVDCLKLGERKDFCGRREAKRDELLEVKTLSRIV